MPFLIGALVVSTSIWVYFDASKLGVQASGERPKWFQFHADMEPVDWVVSFLLLWFVAFPAYLVLRRGYSKRSRQLRLHRPPTEPVEYFYEQIRNLSRQKSEGLISDEEFALRRKRVLGL